MGSISHQLTIGANLGPRSPTEELWNALLQVKTIILKKGR